MVSYSFAILTRVFLNVKSVEQKTVVRARSFYQLRVEASVSDMAIVGRDGNTILWACANTVLPIDPVPISAGVLFPRLEWGRKWL